jgi:S-adenosylmethionine:diacylglycerol 3-amino-3-carboxypropyl transferase
MSTLDSCAPVNPTTASNTPWASGRLSRIGRRQRLLFGATYEDPQIELEALAGCDRIFCIAGAGDTARALSSAGHRVTAVDINAAQVAYAEARTNGGPFRPGAAERIMSIGRFLMRAAGWSTSRLETFTAATDVDAQLNQWEELTSHRGGLLLRTLLSPARLARAFQPAFVCLVGPRFAERLIKTLRAALAKTPNGNNPFARLLFLGEGQPIVSSDSTNRPTFLHTDAITLLRSLPAGSFDGASLSNIGDGTTNAFHQELDAALRHALVPNAPVVVRTMGDLSTLGSTVNLGTLAALQVEPLDAERYAMVRSAAAHDRSLIWAGLEVQHA